VLGVAVLVLFVPDLRWKAEPGAAQASPRAVGGLLRDRRVVALAVAAGLLGLVTVSDGFVYLSLQRKLAAPADVFPLFLLGSSAVYLVLAIPLGRLADRIGRRTVFIAGHVGLVLLYLLLLSEFVPGWHRRQDAVRSPAGRGRGGGPVSDGGTPVKISRARVVAFAAIAVLVIAGGGTYVLRAARQSDAAVAAAAASESAAPRLDAAAVLKLPHLVVRNTALGPSNGEIAVVPLSNPGGPRAIVDVRCERVYSVARGGFCLTAHRGVVTTYQGQLLGPDLQPERNVKVVGGPSRPRLSPDATRAASTVFVSGHSYRTPASPR